MHIQLIALRVQTFKIMLLLTLPSVLVGILLGLAINIFQATTSINVITLSFIAKFLEITVYFATEVFNMIPSFVR